MAGSLNSAAFSIFVVACIGLFASGLPALADDNGDSTVIEDIYLPQPKISHFPGENIETPSLELTIDHEDVRIPGSNGMDIVVGRKYRKGGSTTGQRTVGFGSGFDFKIPYITASEDIYGHVVPRSGYECLISKTRFLIDFYMPDSPMTTVGFPSTAYLQPGTLLAFTNNSILKCESGLPVILRADGSKLTFGKEILRMVEVAGAMREYTSHHLSKMEDRFGNVITYTYGSDVLPTPSSAPTAKLTSISRNDGASVNFEHIVAGTGLNARTVISKITYGGREINFTYVKPYGRTHTIETVLDEENRVTHFEYILHGWLKKITIPTGAQAEYTYETVNPDAGLNGQVRTKKISGPHMKTREFTYLYRPDSSFFLHHADIIQTETDAVGSVEVDTVYTIKNRPMGTAYSSDELALDMITNGTLRQLLVIKGGTPQAFNGEYIYKQLNEWVPVRHGAVGCQKRTQRYGQYKTCARARLEKKTIVIYNPYDNLVDVFESDPYNYDAYGFAQKTKETGSVSGAYRYKRQTYLHDTTNWIIGLPRISYQSNTDGSWVETFQRSYHAVSLLPEYEYEFGRWTKHFQLYNGSGDIEKISYNGSNRIEVYKNYKRGHAQEIQLPHFSSGHSTMLSRYEYVDNFGNVIQAIDFRGNSRSYTYDGLNRLTKADFANSAWADEIVSYYDSSDYSLKQIGSRSIYRYHDGLGRTRLVRDEDTTQSAETRTYQKFTYTKQGQKEFVSFKSASANPINGITYDYDLLGRNTEESIPETGTVRTRAYKSGHVIELLDGLDNPTVTTYQSFGVPHYETPVHINEMVAAATGPGPGPGPGDEDPPCHPSQPVCWDPHGDPSDDSIAPRSTTAEYIDTYITYDLHDNVVSVSQGGQTTSYIYDSYKKLCKISRPDVGDTAMQYSPVGQLQWSIKGATGSNTVCGSTSSINKINYTFDYRGDLREFADNAGTTLRSYGRDNDGNIAGAVSGDFAFHSFYYDDRNNLKAQAAGPSGNRFDWFYNANGHLESIKYPNSVTYDLEPNAKGQPTRIGDLAHSASYHPTGELESLTYGNGIVRTMARNDAGVLQDIIDTSASTTRFEHYYDYDSELNLLSLYDAFQPAYELTSLQYDGVGRLKRVDGVWGIATISYDDLSNIQSMSLGGASRTYNYNASNQLTSVTGAVSRSFSYDGYGNVTSNGARSFTYDKLSQLKASGAITFKYDAYGVRVAKTEGSTTTYFDYAPSGPLLFKESTDGSQTAYFFLGDQLVAEQNTTGTSTSTKYLHTDALGSVSAESNASGSVTKRYHYEPFGTAIETGQTDDPGFTGQIFDEDLGLNYMKARYYDPEIGRFYSSDPVGFRAYNTATFNRYAYGNNNPYKYTDPNGEHAVEVIVVIASADAAVPEPSDAFLPKYAGYVIVFGAAAIIDQIFFNEIGSSDDAEEAPPADDASSGDADGQTEEPNPEQLAPEIGKRAKAADDALQHLEEIERAQDRARKSGEGSKIEFIEKSRQRAKHQLDRINLDDIEYD